MDPADPHDLRNAAEEPIFETNTIAIAGMHSESCAHDIERALRATDGVKKATVDLARERVEVTFDARKTHVPALHDIILGTGYKPAGVEATS